MNTQYDLIVVGSGAAGIVAAIVAARNNKKVLLLEKLPKIAAKLKATGGGRCNLSNTLSNETFMEKFGKDGRFMQDALHNFNHTDLIKFLANIGIETHAPDGFRIFPTTHSSQTIIDAFTQELKQLQVTVLCNQRVERILVDGSHVTGVKTQHHTFKAAFVILATGGMGYPTLGAEGDGYTLAGELGHKITTLSPAMMPLQTKEKWVAQCRADTIAKVTLRINLKKYKKLKAQGDLIFTKNGIRGPVVLDFAREITPLLHKYKEVPLLANFTKGMHEEQIQQHLKKVLKKDPHATLLTVLKTLLPTSLATVFTTFINSDPHTPYKEISGVKKEKLYKLLAQTPLHVIGHDGFKMAMITRGGITLKEVNPKTMQSRLIKGLYFCGELLNLDGPCGGYNLQWSFSSGYLAGMLQDS